MIEGGWPFVVAAYAVAAFALTVLVSAILFGARRWSREARKLDNP